MEVDQKNDNIPSEDHSCMNIQAGDKFTYKADLYSIINPESPRKSFEMPDGLQIFKHEQREEEHFNNDI